MLCMRLCMRWKMISILKSLLECDYIQLETSWFYWAAMGTFFFPFFRSLTRTIETLSTFLPPTVPNVTLNPHLSERSHRPPPRIKNHSRLYPWVTKSDPHIQNLLKPQVWSQDLARKRLRRIKKIDLALRLESSKRRNVGVFALHLSGIFIHRADRVSPTCQMWRAADDHCPAAEGVTGSRHSGQLSILSRTNKQRKRETKLPSL